VPSRAAPATTGRRPVVAAHKKGSTFNRREGVRIRAALTLRTSSIIGLMQPPTVVRAPNRYEKRLYGLRAHPTLGPSVKLYFRRREQLLYLVVGGWNTLFGYGFWALLQYALGGYLPYLVVLVLAWPVAVLNAYLGYRHIVFRSHAPVRSELPRFLVVYLATFGAILGLLPVCLRVLPFNIYWVQAFLTGAIVVCSYLSLKYFSFQGGHPRRLTQTSSESPSVVHRD